MAGHGSALFSVRWTSRVYTEEQERKLVFSSLASGGSRIMLDGTMVLDRWEMWGSTFVSEVITVDDAGYHILVYEYRSAASLENIPTNSYAVLASSNEGAVAAFGDTNRTRTAMSPELYADIGWLACLPGSGTIHGRPLEAGFVQATSDLTTNVAFGSQFTTVPMVFGGLTSINSLKGHLRLLEASEEHTSLATEYDTCNAVVAAGLRTLSWIAISAPADMIGSAVTQQPTRMSDKLALLRITESLGLPDYLQWRNGSDPCGDRWAGIECRAVAGEHPRVVVLDVRVALFLLCPRVLWCSFHPDSLVLHALCRCTIST